MRLTTTRSLVLAALAGLALTMPTHAQSPAQPSNPPLTRAAAGDALPITDITLYRSGVGSFLRTGSVSGNQRVSLKYDVNQINDVLKTLQVLDLDRGRIEAVSFASKDPLSRRLASFSVNISDNPSLPQLFERLRGSPVTIESAVAGKVSGTVLSVESRKMPSSDSKDAPVVDTSVVNLITGGGIRSVPVPTILNFNINDPKLAEEMTKALTALADSRAERIKTVDLSLAGEGDRRIAVAYVHETPVWKTSYRLLLPESVDPAKPDPTDIAPMLKGWALVENTTDNDWTNVKLSLVSGRPVSFKMDLSEPMYVWRPDVPVPTVAGVMPKEYSGGVDSYEKLQDKAKADSSTRYALKSVTVGTPGGPAPAAKPAMAGGLGFRGESGSAGEADGRSMGVNLADAMADYGAKAQAHAGEVGEVFQYTLNSPVTIERQRSAMIPIIDANIKGRRVSIYNMQDRADHPMRGAEITNSSNLQLLPGPIAVYDGAAYTGDAQIGQVSAGDKRLLAYALDLDVAVVTKPINDWNVTKLKVVNGYFERTSLVREGTEYIFDNKDLKRGRNIVLEHPKSGGWTLAKGTAEPAEQTQSLYRFNLSVDAGKAATTTIVQERIDVTQMGVMDFDLKTLLSFRQQGKLSDAVVNAVKEAFTRQDKVTELTRQEQQVNQQIETAKKDQTQLVDMMNKLDRQNPNYATFSTRLTKITETLESAERNRASIVEKLTAARNDLQSYISNLNVE